MKRTSGAIEPFDLDDGLFENVERLFHETLYKNAARVIQEMLDGASVYFASFGHRRSHGKRLSCILSLDVGAGLNTLFFELDLQKSLDDSFVMIEDDPGELLQDIIEISKQFRLAADMIDQRVKRIKMS